MSFFIIGNPSSVWLKEYIKHIHIKNNHKVYVTVFEMSDLKFVNEYREMGVQFVNLGEKGRGIKKISKFLRLFFFAYRNRNNQFDILEVQSPPHNVQAFVIGMIARLMDCKTFIMFWGSDILAISSKDAEKLEYAIKNADVINRPGEQTYKAFTTFFGHKYEKLFTKKSLRFGTLALPWIERTRAIYDKVECKKHFGLAADKMSIAIGYNGHRRHQHLKVIDEFSKLSISQKNKLQLIIHFVGYDDLAYEELLKNALKNCGIEYVFIARSLDFSEIAVLRLATDIFIHAQTTDGLSGSIRECLYAGTIVVNPVWIEYGELKKIGVEYIEYQEFSELNDIIENCIQEKISINLEKNRELIYDHYSWEALEGDWISVFNSMI